MIDISDCKTLNDIAIKLFNKKNYTNREKVKKYLKENGIEWTEWLENNKKKPIVYCECCGKVIEKPYKGQRFCSRSCATTINNIIRGERPLETKAKIALSHELKKGEIDIEAFWEEIRNINYSSGSCLNCGKEIKRSFRSKNSFCSNKCQQEYKRKEYIKRWKNGEESGLSGEYGLSKIIRNYLLNKHNYKCECCGWGEENQYTHTIPLEIHHKDGDYTNNIEENLQVLCPNCHSLTENIKSHNKQGRKGRSKYYK